MPRQRKLYPAFGREQTLEDWANEYHLKLGTLITRYYTLEMPLEEALTKKLRRNHRSPNAWGVK